MLPEPTISFTLPSLHDGTLLDCRVFLPQSVLAAASRDPKARKYPRWQGNAAVVAHPYAPMGGTQDDHIVKLVGQRLLKRSKKPPTEQFVVATFNFRGASRAAGRSAGRTSWTAKPETGDYAAVVGFLYYFAHYLDPYGEKEAERERLGEQSAEGTLAPPTPTSVPHLPVHPVFICAGYSYGAMVTTMLPPLPEILASFASPSRDSAAAEIRRRSSRLAAAKNADFSEVRAAIAEEEAAAKAAEAAEAAAKEAAATPFDLHSPQSPQSPTKGTTPTNRLSKGVRIGGSEDNQWRRRSQEVSRRSIISSAASIGRRSLSSDHSGHPLRPSGSVLGHSILSEERTPGRPSAVSGLLKKVRPGKNSSTSSSIRSEDETDRHPTTESSKDEVGTKPAAPAVSTAKPQDPNALPVVLHLPVVRPAYLLVSLPMGLATNLATLSFTSPSLHHAPSKRRGHTTSSSSAGSVEDVDNNNSSSPAAPGSPTTAVRTSSAQGKMVTNPTLVVYGDADAFASSRKLQQWTMKMTDASRSFSTPPGIPLFQARKVATAGHFWTEGRTLYELQDTVDAFLDGLAEASEPAPPSGTISKDKFAMTRSEPALVSKRVVSGPGSLETIKSGLTIQTGPTKSIVESQGTSAAYEGKKE